jgi:replicative DNA helicase
MGNVIGGERNSRGERETIGPVSLAQVMEDVDARIASGESEHLRPVPTGFYPLDDVLNGGLHLGELLMIGGPYGVGKTIWGLQVARNVVYNEKDAAALYVCYEHDRAHLMSRLMCLESAELGHKEDALTLRKLADLSMNVPPGMGLTGMLRQVRRYGEVLDRMATYASRLFLVKASSAHSTLDQVQQWAQEVQEGGLRRVLLVVDYLQKVPLGRSDLAAEEEVTTYLAQGLKEMAMALEIAVIAIAASDRLGLKAKRMRLADLRGSSALQYEADIGLILNNKFDIISREHMVYNPAQAQSIRNWVVLSVEKNRAGIHAVDMEYLLDAVHFRIVPKGDFVRERLVDEKVFLE